MNNLNKSDKIFLDYIERRLTCVGNVFEIVILIRVMNVKLLAFILMQRNLSQMIITT